MNDKYTGQGRKKFWAKKKNKRLTTYISQYTDVGAVLLKENCVTRPSTFTPQYKLVDVCMSGSLTHSSHPRDILQRIIFNNLHESVTQNSKNIQIRHYISSTYRQTNNCEFISLSTRDRRCVDITSTFNKY